MCYVNLLKGIERLCSNSLQAGTKAYVVLLLPRRSRPWNFAIDAFFDCVLKPCEEAELASAGLQIEEPQYTRRRVREFLNSHTCYELIPESGKVVLLDIDLPVRQAFHALHEQGVASAPLWDSDQIAVVGMISASDFINVLRRLRSR